MNSRAFLRKPDQTQIHYPSFSNRERSETLSRSGVSQYCTATTNEIWAIVALRS